MYEVLEDHIILEMGIPLEEGMVFNDGDLEPDVIANLYARRIVSRDGVTAPYLDGEPMPPVDAIEEPIPEDDE